MQAAFNSSEFVFFFSFVEFKMFSASYVFKASIN